VQLEKNIAANRFCFLLVVVPIIDTDDKLQQVLQSQKERGDDALVVLSHLSQCSVNRITDLWDSVCFALLAPQEVTTPNIVAEVSSTHWHHLASSREIYPINS